MRPMRRSLSIINLLLATTLLAWPLGLFMVLFMFDAPGSASSVVTDALAWSIIAYPVPVVAGNIAYWIRRKDETVEQLRIYTAVTLSGPVLVAVAYLALHFICDGKFACA